MTQPLSNSSNGVQNEQYQLKKEALLALQKNVDPKRFNEIRNSIPRMIRKKLIPEAKILDASAPRIGQNEDVSLKKINDARLHRIIEKRGVSWRKCDS